MLLSMGRSPRITLKASLTYHKPRFPWLNSLHATLRLFHSMFVVSGALVASDGQLVLHPGRSCVISQAAKCWQKHLRPQLARLRSTSTALISNSHHLQALRQRRSWRRMVPARYRCECAHNLHESEAPVQGGSQCSLRTGGHVRVSNMSHTLTTACLIQLYTCRYTPMMHT